MIKRQWVCPQCSYRWTLRRIKPPITCGRCQYREEKPATERVNVQMPKLRTRARNYTRAVKEWQSAGRPVRSDDEVAAIFNQHCATCPLFVDNKCSHDSCGCNVMASEGVIGGLLTRLQIPQAAGLVNKLRAKTEVCPVGKWGYAIRDRAPGDTIKDGVHYSPSRGYAFPVDALEWFPRLGHGDRYERSLTPVEEIKSPVDDWTFTHRGVIDLMRLQGFDSLGSELNANGSRLYRWQKIDEVKPAAVELFFDGRIGDFILLADVLPEEIIANVETIYYTSSIWRELATLIDDLEDWTVKHHVHVETAAALEFAEDVRVGQVLNKRSRKNWARRKTDLFDLPKTFFVIAPTCRERHRNFRDDDWREAYRQASIAKLPVVVLSDETVKTASDAINLSGKTTVAEAIAITSRACGFAGTASSLSIVAANHLRPPRLLVKDREHAKRAWRQYYPAQPNDSFFGSTIEDAANNAKTAARPPAIKPGVPLTIKTANGIGDLCWVAAAIANVKEALNVPSINLVVQRVGDHRCGRSLPMVDNWKFLDSVTTQPLEWHQPPHVMRLSYCPNQYNDDGSLTLFVNPWIEFDGRLEEMFPDVPPCWDMLSPQHYAAPASAVKDAKRWLGFRPKKTACIHLGCRADNSTHGMNRGPVWKLIDWSAVVASIRANRIFIIGARYDKGYADELCSLCPDRRLVNLCGKTTTETAIEILRRTSLVVGFASGIPIASTYLQTPTVMFWRPEGNPPHDREGWWFGNDFATNWIPPYADWYQPAFYGIDNAASVIDKIRRIT